MEGRKQHDRVHIILSTVLAVEFVFALVVNILGGGAIENGRSKDE